MKVGYVRVSTPKQIRDHSIPIQTNALKEQGCCPVFIEQYSGHSVKRPKLNKALLELRQASHVHKMEAENNYRSSHKNRLRGFKYAPRDELVCYKLDRLARNMRDGLNIIHDLIDEGVKVVILRPKKMVVDTSTVNGKIMLDMLLMFADIERDMIKERMQNGRVGEKGNGGRPSRLHSKRAEAYKSIYNDYINRTNDKNAHPTTYRKTVKYSPARMVAISRGTTVQTIYRIVKSLRQEDFDGKVLLKHYK